MLRLDPIGLIVEIRVPGAIICETKMVCVHCRSYEPALQLKRTPENHAGCDAIITCASSPLRMYSLQLGSCIRPDNNSFDSTGLPGIVSHLLSRVIKRLQSSVINRDSYNPCFPEVHTSREGQPTMKEWTKRHWIGWKE